MKNTLTISNLHVSVEKKEILKGIALKVHDAEVHAVMGPNGGGKSTLAYALMGHPTYEIDNSTSDIQINKKKILELAPEERAKTLT